MAKTVKKAETPAKTPEVVKAPVAAEAAKTPAVAETKPVVKETKEVKTPAKPKAAPKKAVKKATPKKAAPKKAAKTPAAAAPVTKVFVEYQGRQMDMDAILEAVKTASGKKRFKSLEIYVKPEDGAAYYVVNGKDSGKADL